MGQCTKEALPMDNPKEMDDTRLLAVATMMETGRMQNTKASGKFTREMDDTMLENGDLEGHMDMGLKNILMDV